jgi:3'-5' exoribonuclease
MSRRFVNQLAHQEAIDQVFLAANKQLRPNKNGNLYLQVEVSDRTGSLSARLWNATEAQYRSFEEGANVPGGDANHRYAGLESPGQRDRS